MELVAPLVQQFVLLLVLMILSSLHYMNSEISALLTVLIIFVSARLSLSLSNGTTAQGGPRPPPRDSSILPAVG